MTTGHDPWDEQEHIGTYIKSERKKLGMTMSELAVQTGLSQGAISMIENGIRQATPQTLRKICDALQIDMPADSAETLPIPDKKISRYMTIETLGFALTLEFKSFTSDIEDDAINAAVHKAFTQEIEHMLLSSDTIDKITTTLKETLQAEIDKKRNEMKKIYHKLENNS